MSPLFIEPCLPTINRIVPTGPMWACEIKHDGFRFVCVRQGECVRVYSRGAHDWAAQLPAIVEAMQALPVKSAAIDGEGVICGRDGKSDFDRMRACFSRHGAPEAFLYAFDLLDYGRDLRGEPWARRRAALAKSRGTARRRGISKHQVRVGGSLGGEVYRQTLKDSGGNRHNEDCQCHVFRYWLAGALHRFPFASASRR